MDTQNNKPGNEVILSKIYWFRDQKVMLDYDLSALYEIETKQLKRAVRRNIERFPEDFMFELTKEEFENLRSQSGTSSWGGTRYAPMAFTEQGVAMLSSVLNSSKAIAVNISIMRIFTRMRYMAENQQELLIKIKEIEAKLTNHDQSIRQVFGYLKELISEPQKKNSIGFKISKSDE